MERKKSLQWANDESIAANRLNNGEACWLVEDESGLPPFVYSASEKELAFEIYNEINLPVSPLCITLTKDWK